MLYDARFRFITLFAALTLLFGVAGCSGDNPSAGSQVTSPEDDNNVGDNNGGPDIEDTGDDTGEPDTVDDPPDVTPDAVEPTDTGDDDDAGAPNNNNNTNNDTPDVPDVALPDTVDDTGVIPDAVVQERFVRLLGVEPSIGETEGGTEVFIHVEVNGALHDPIVLFAGREATGVEVLGPETLLVYTPPGVPGGADVKILDGDVDDTLSGAFTYFAPLELDDIDPTRSLSTGGQSVTLTGASFSDDVQVSFGGRAAIETVVLDSSTIVTTTPPGVAGWADVRVTNSYDSVVLIDGMLYFDRVYLEQVLPAAGPTEGGNVVSLIGRGLTPGADVTFGGQPASVINAVGSTRLEVVVPAGPTGSVDVGLSSLSGTTGIPRGYTYTGESSADLTLASVQPGFGAEVGGREVILGGFGFDADNLTVTFGGATAQLIEVLDTAIRVRTPAHAPGVVDVVVTNDNGAATLPGSFEYLTNLVVAEVQPDAGPVEGGTDVVITGVGFDASTRFFFGPLEATGVELVSDVEVRAVTPPGSLGANDVRAVRGATSATRARGYSYTAPVEVGSVFPARGSISGGTYIEIRGSGFTEDVAVALGNNACLEVQVIDQATIVCYTPPALEGAVDVKVTVSGVEYAAPDRFIYYHPASRFGGAWGEHITGAVNVSVFSISGEPVGGAFVMLTVDGDTEYQGFADDNGLITFSGPDVLGDQFVSATAAAHSSSTVQAVNAENITLLLFPTVPPSGGGGGGALPLATITGQVGGFQKIAEPGPDERQIIIVETTRESPTRSNPWPGTGNVVDPNGDRTYTLQSRIGDLAVVAIGGLINDRTGEFTPYAYGIARYLFVSQDNVYEVNLELEKDLNQVLNFKLNGATFSDTGPDINRITPWVDLGFEGFFGGWDIAEGIEDEIAAIHQPRLDGDLEDASFYIHGGSWTQSGSPYSVGVLNNVTDVSGIIELPALVGAAKPLIPADGGYAEDRYVAFEPLNSNAPDFWQIQLYQLPNTQVWEITIPGHQNWFLLPNFPDFSSLPFEDRPTPYNARGPLYMVITGARIEASRGFDFDQHEYLNDMRRRDRWESWTRTAYYVTLTP